MKYITVEYKIYQYDELDDKAKARALCDWNEFNDYGNDLYEQMYERLTELLEQNKIECNELDLRYSLSYCQGDGVSFTGVFRFKDIDFELKRRDNHYYHYKTVILYDKSDGEFTENHIRIQDEFTYIFRNICKELETLGYQIIEYQTSEEVFLCEIDGNGYMFHKNGKMFSEFPGEII